MGITDVPTRSSKLISGTSLLFKVGGLEASVLGIFKIGAGPGDLRTGCVKDSAERWKGEVQLLAYLLRNATNMLSNPVC